MIGNGEEILTDTEGNSNLFPCMWMACPSITRGPKSRQFKNQERIYYCNCKSNAMNMNSDRTTGSALASRLAASTRTAVPERSESNGGSSRRRTQRGSGEERMVTVRSSARAMARLGLATLRRPRASGPGRVALPET